MSKAYDDLVKQNLPKDFDWEYYLEIHPDLSLAGIGDEDTAIKHYVLHGKRENRIYSDQKIKDYNKAMNKTVINCYHDNSTSGLGDFLRGSLHLYDISERFNFSTHMSFFHHPIGKHIQSKYRRNFPKKHIVDIYHETVKEHGTNYSLHHLKDKFDYLLNQPNKHYVYISSMYADQLFPEPDKTVIQQFEEYVPLQTTQKLMKSNIVFSNSIRSMAKVELEKYKLKPKNYNVIHLRLGDHDILKKEMNIKNPQIINQTNFKNYNIDYEKLVRKCIKISKNKRTVIIADSNEFKEYVAKKNIDNFIVMHQNSKHCSPQPGLIAHTDNHNSIKEIELRYVILDFYLMTLAKSINSFSVYPWGSGFPYSAAKIYNIPLKMEIIE